MRKVLIISPTPTHPTNAGNRVHILALSKLLRENGFDVHMLLLAYETYDEAQMTDFWGEKLYIIERERLFAKGLLLKYYFKRVADKLIRARRFLQMKSGAITKHQYLYNANVDSFFPRGVKGDIVRIQKNNQFEIVVSEYATMSKALTFFDKKVKKVLDTHDKFTDRFQVYLNNDLPPQWVSLHRSEEIKAVKRADLVIALQHKERGYFETLGAHKVIRFFSMPQFEKLPIKLFEKKLLYFASDNSLNVSAIENFERVILPQVLKAHPTVQVLVGGNICNRYKSEHESIHLLGQFANVRDFYAQGDIVINPELDGTGFKIKTMEALCFRLPVVCTVAGASGLTSGNNEHLMIAETEKEFATILTSVLDNKELIDRQKEKIDQWFENMKKQMSDELIDQLKYGNW